MLTLFALVVPLLGSIPVTQGLLGKLEVGKLPALGWNSWNAYGCDISEEKFLSAAQKLVDLGLKVNIFTIIRNSSLTSTGCRI
jgi:alpha-galactosidase